MTADQAVELLIAAGLVTNENEKSARDIVTATSRGSIMMLDNLGIVVKEEDVKRCFAKKVFAAGFRLQKGVHVEPDAAEIAMAMNMKRYKEDRDESYLEAVMAVLKERQAIGQ